MISRVIEWSLRHRLAVALAFGVFGVWGAVAFQRNPVDAIPDLTDPQVIVFADWPGRSAQEVEDQVTYPVVTNLQGLPGIRVVRSQSVFGFAMVYAVLDEGADVRQARTRVLERLNLVGGLLPEGVVPVLGPEATGVGHVFWYTLTSPTRSARDLRALQDWFVRYQLNAVPGVAEVAAVGGTVRQFQIDVDPERLRAFGIGLADVVAAVRASNANVGGNVVNANGAWAAVRGVGLVETAADFETIPLRSTPAGAALFLRDVASVKVGDAFRSAALLDGEREAVGGVVVARADANTRAVIAAVKARLPEIEAGLPADVTLVPFYDRSALIDRTVDTLRFALLEEILLVTLAHVLFLRHLRSIIIVTLPLPLAVLCAFLAMSWAGMTSNIMSLAGIAIAIGVLVDAGIVVTENAFRVIEQRQVDTADRAAVRDAVLASARTVGRPVFFAMAIVVLAFVPVFALTGQEGRLFHPLAFTKTAAVLAATVMAVTLVPVLCAWLIRGHVHAEADNRLMRWLRALYRPALHGALRHPALTIGGAVIFFLGSLAAGAQVGREFMPPLDEGDLLFMPVTDPSVSLDEAIRQAKRQNAALQRVPEVETVVAKVGRADTSTDPSPVNMTETIVHLKPRAEWRPDTTLDSLRAEMTRAVALPGVSTVWTMPIINRIDMLSTGIRTEVGVKVFGADLAVLERIALHVADVVRAVPGAATVYPEPLTRGQYLDVRVRREEAARYGLSVRDIDDVVAYAIGETDVGTVIDGRQRFPVRVRFDAGARATADAVSRALVTAPSGQHVVLSDVADIVSARGPAMISAENGLLVATVLIDVQGRDAGGFVSEARSAVQRAVRLPTGYAIGWSGRFESQERAERRLLLVVPAVVLVIFLLLMWTYRSAIEAAHVLLAVPFALSGGLYLVWLLGYNFSVAVWIGFIALFGTAVQTAVVMVIYLEEAADRAAAHLGTAFDRPALRAAVIDGALLRLRPKIMTVSTVVAGLLPIMWSHRTGAEVMRPLAAPVLGGMASSLVLVLVITPILFFWSRARRLPPEPAAVRRPRSRPRPVAVLGAVAVTAAVAWFAWSRGVGSRHDVGEAWPVVAARTSDGLSITIRSATGHFQLEPGTYVVEFRASDDQRPVAVRDVVFGGAMAMPGMTMTAPGEVAAAGATGRVTARLAFDMAGEWRMTLSWRDVNGAHTVSFDGDVR
jgi:Cu(I)/Ag(I) efflux system membrane protein CusA/SilA